MAGKNDLRIRIVGTLSTGLSIGEINKKIKEIEKHASLKKLKIKMDIDDKVLKTLTEFNKQMQKIANASKYTSSQLGNNLKNQGAEVDNLNAKYRNLAQTINRLDEKGRTKGSTLTYKNDSGTRSKTLNVDPDGKQVGGSTQKINHEKELKLAEQAARKKIEQEEKLANQIASKREKAIQKRIQDEKKLAEAQAKSSNKAMENDKKSAEKMQQNITKAKTQAQKQLQDLARTGKYTNEELKKIGKGINLSTSIKQIDQLKNRMSNMKIGDSLKTDQDRIRNALKKVYDQGKVNEQFFKNFNKVIDGAKNVAEIKKIEKALKRVGDNATNKQLQQKLKSDAETLMRTHSRSVNKNELNQLIQSLKQVKPNAKNASNQLKQMQNQLKDLKNEAKEAARSSMTFGNMISQAFQKFPVDNTGGNKTSLIAGNPLEPFKLQHKDEISLNVNV